MVSVIQITNPPSRQDLHSSANTLGGASCAPQVSQEKHPLRKAHNPNPALLLCLICSHDVPICSHEKQSDQLNVTSTFLCGFLVHLVQNSFTENMPCSEPLFKQRPPSIMRHKLSVIGAIGYPSAAIGQTSTAWSGANIGTSRGTLWVSHIKQPAILFFRPCMTTGFFDLQGMLTRNKIAATLDAFHAKCTINPGRCP